MQKLLKLKEVRIKVEEESKGEVIVGPSRQALKHLGTGNTFHPDTFSAQVYLDCRCPNSLLYQKLFWLLGETSEEEEGETEEPETSTKEQARFDWACIWMEEGVCWHWQRLRLRDYLPRYFPLEPPFSFALSSTLSLCSFPGSPSDYLIFLAFFRHCASCIKPVFCSSRQNTWRPVASNRWSLWWPDQRLRACMTSSEWPWPSQIFPHLLAYLHPKGTGRCLLL